MSLSNNDRGSYSLGALAAVFTAATATLAYLNFSRYILAINAAEQAATVAVRCLSTTDSPCGESGSSQPLYDYYSQSPTITGRHTQNILRYKASYIEDQYVASYPVYEEPLYAPPVVVERSHGIPISRFEEVPLIERRFGKIAVRITEHFPAQLLPLALHSDNSESVVRATPFPSYRAEEEEQSDRLEQSPEEWLNKNSSGVHYRPLITSRWIEIKPGSTRQYEASSELIPELPLKDSACAAGYSCGLSQFGEEKNFRKNAYVAIKAFAEVAPLDTNHPAEIRWGDDQRGRWGLEIQSGLSKRCLGGSDYRSFSRPGWLSLRLRGPIGSVGGGANNSVCPDGSFQHHAIKVERGTSFTIRSWISAKRSSGRVRVRLHFYYYYDNYQVRHLPPRAQSAECPEMELLDEAQLSCPRIEACGLRPDPTAVSRQVNCQVVANSVRLTSECQNFGQRERQSTPTSVTVDYPTCHQGQTPPSRGPCGWRYLGPVGTIHVGLTSGLCPLARTIEEKFECDTAPVSCSSLQPPTLLCRNVAQRILESERALPTIPLLSHQSEHIHPIRAENFSYVGAPRPIGYVETLPSSLSSLENSDCKVIKTIRSSDELYIPRGSPLPTLEQFRFNQAGQSPGYLHPSYLHSDFTIQRLGERVVEITDIFPFKEPTAELSLKLPTTGIRQDGSQSFANSLDELLRAYATVGYPFLYDLNIGLVTSAELERTVVLPTFDNTAAYDERFITHFHPDGGFACSGKTRIALAQPTEPPNCKNQGCPCLRVVSGKRSRTVKDRAELAKALAFAELSRFFPNGMKEGCNDGGCATVSIDIDTSQASVDTQLTLPITFPLDLLLGETVAVSASKMEPIEIGNLK